MNIYKKTKNGGPVKIDKDFYPRNAPKRFELHLFRAFDVLNMVILYQPSCISFFLIAGLQLGILRSTLQHRYNAGDGSHKIEPRYK